MILALAALAAAAQPNDANEPGRSCAALARTAPEQALAAAERLIAAGQAVPGRQCLGLGLIAQERWEGAATAFEQAARDAEAAQDGRRADLWVQAGNAWVAAGQGERAVQALDAALQAPGLSDPQRAQVHLDRAHAQVGLRNLAGARSDIDRALELTASDPQAWYLSAALARRERNLDRAQSDIRRALELAPQEPGIILLAGTIAGLAGNAAEAERLYRRVVEIAPESEPGRAAQASLATITEVEIEAPAAEPGDQPRPQQPVDQPQPR